MATSPEPEAGEVLSVDSYDTALCLIPPKELWGPIENLRALYDKAYEKWAPHVNLVYPFVAPQHLPQAAERIVSALEEKAAAGGGSNRLDVSLTAAGCFSHRQSATIYRHDTNPQRLSALKEMRSMILRRLGEKRDGRFTMHMSVAQSETTDTDLDKFILNKASLLPCAEWTASHLVILVRRKDQSGPNAMKFWGAIDLQTARLVREPGGFALELDRALVRKADVDPAIPGETFTLSSHGEWTPLAPSDKYTPTPPENIVVATYNVLAEFIYPPSQVRYPLVVQNLVSESALADILVLEEVTDDFLPFLLSNQQIRERYSFVTHGPPQQADIGPLPSLLNQVVLSRCPFHWKLLQLKRRHKTSAVLTFPTIGKTDDDGFHPLVLATCHLTHGLTDGSVATKKGELQRIIDFLECQHMGSPWLLAGDFNITTSSYTIDQALKKKAITNQTTQYLASLDTMLSDAGFLDSWLVARCEVGESSDDLRRPKEAWETFEGEQGATFDPTENQLAFKIVGGGFNNRPQRYDRILVKPEGVFHVGGFNMFGFSTMDHPDGKSDPLYGSDHWGVRCLLRTNPSGSLTSQAGGAEVVPVSPKRAPASLADQGNLKKSLQDLARFPTEEDEATRKQAFELLKDTIEKAADAGFQAATVAGRPRTPLVVTPVGSYGLGVWTRDSDIDCMCIGSFSSRTFFAIAIPKLRATDGIKILRRVKANSGTMLELEVKSIKMDLQYCSSATIAERWPHVMKRPASDPVFTLPAQSLLKLKPARDLFYLRRSIPDLAQFRLAYLLIKTWAKERGIFAAKFGYLGGIHLSTMLVRVCKMLLHDGGIVSVSDVIVTFFDHYANFDWKTQMVFDPFFHKKLRYTRTFREPLCLLGWHAPTLNTALAASMPTVKTIVAELNRAKHLLSQPGMTWSIFLGLSGGVQAEQAQTAGASGAASFLNEYKSYIKVDVHYWGPSQQKGNQFVGWLESRCVLLLVEMDKKVPDLVARIWPTKFVPVSDADKGRESEEYRGCFLIGLELSSGESEAGTKDNVKIVEGALQGVVTQFEARMRGDEKYYDAKTCWMAATITRAGKLGQLELDKKDWGTYTGGDGDTDSESEDDEMEEDEDENTDEGVEQEKKRLGGSASQASGLRARTAVKPKAPGKFRTAADVMNRLRWDEKMDSGDYLVGYEDRFVGAREKALDSWKSEQTDEEFIPQHRILYFKRKTDGVIVWERSTRTDMVFGSGV